MQSNARNMPVPLEPFPNIVSLCVALNSPLCVMDVETTGFGFKAQIVEMAYVWVGRDGRQGSQSFKVNPKIQISPMASRVHGLYNRDVAHCPSLEHFAPTLKDIFSRYTVSGFNSDAYDVPLLMVKLEEMGIAVTRPTTIDVRKLWKRFSGQRAGKLDQVAQHYGARPGPAHEALGDVVTTARILEAMIAVHGLPAVLSQANLSLAPSAPELALQAA